jgi:glycosyltransferase involved in cell wall biosynthesis
MRVLGFGTYDVRAHPRVGILLDGLRAHGDEVRECNEPLGLDTAGRVRMLRQPWRLPLLLLLLLRRWSALAVRGRRLAAAWDPDVVVVGYLGHFDVLLARLLFPRRHIVLDHMVSAAGTAADRGAPGGVLQRLLRLLDRLATGAANVVVVDTDEHAAVLPTAGARQRAVVAPIGAPGAWFEARPADHDSDHQGPLRAVFFGLYTPLQGATTIGAALPLLGEEVAVTMVGRGQQLEETRAAAGRAVGVTWHDWVEPEDLPSLVAAHDVCLGIVGTTAKARAVVPNKVFQGAAAGCAIVTSDTRPQRAMLGDAAVLVPAGDPRALADALLVLAGDRARLAGLRKAAAQLADERFTPQAVVTDLRARLLTLPRAGSATPG